MLRTFHFHTIHEGVSRPYKVHGTSVADAVKDLRDMLYDDETIVGWESDTLDR